MMPELSRPVRIDALGTGAHRVEIEANASECAALADRFDLLALQRLSAEATVRREGQVIFVEGRVSAAVEQACVATGAPVPATIDEPFSLRFVPAGADAAEEVELDDIEIDTISYEGGSIDIGEAVAETLALSLDPFPRAPDADQTLRAAGIVSEEEAARAGSPFAALGTLRNKLT